MLLRTRIFRLLRLALIGLLLLEASSALANKKRYRKATEDDDEVVKNKLFPKKSRIEISAPSAGTILNQSYINSYVVHGDLAYYWSEAWGLSLEGLYSINSDKYERYCIEHFYNDPNGNVGMSCPNEGASSIDPLIEGEEDGKTVYKAGANLGPAYPGLREINTILTASFLWTPVYGKQLAFMSGTTYFDLFFVFGGGITASTYYAKTLFLKNSGTPRISRPKDLDPDKLKELGNKCDASVLGGVCPDDPEVENLIGKNGRPVPTQESTPTLTFGIGQRFHFAKRFHIKAELRNYTLLGTPAGFDSIFALWAGFGVRF